MASSKKIKLTSLNINTENYRFEPVSSQKEAIDKIVSNQGDKLYNLAAHIVQNGLNPNDKIQVVASSHDKTKFNVLEGNRRVVSLKLLLNPDILDGSDQTQLRKKFRKLQEEYRATLLKDVQCTVYDSPAEADKWIKLKHAGEVEGVGTVAWTAQQVQRFEEKVEGKSSVALQTIKILQNSSDVPAVIKSNLSALKVTNLDRLLSDPDVRDMIGIDINNGIIQSEIDEREVVKGLTQIAKDLMNPQFNVKKIYTKEDRKDYITKFPKQSKPDLRKKAPRPWQFVGVNVASAGKPKPKPNPKDRDYLIPRSCVLSIKAPKVNAIYHELQKLSVSKYTNAAAVSLRVFIELSMDTYIEENGLTRANINSSLLAKITEVANHLESNTLADKHICKGIRSAVNNKNDLVGIETWHAYVHNPKFRPTAPNLIITWDNIQAFMENVWANIK